MKKARPRSRRLLRDRRHGRFRPGHPLFAPASGKETRQKISEEAEKTGEKARKTSDKISKEAEKGIKVVREKTQEGLDAIREFIDKKKEEFLKRGPEGLPHDKPKA